MALTTIGPQWVDKKWGTVLNNGMFLVTRTVENATGGHDLIGQVMDDDGSAFGAAFTITSYTSPAEVSSLDVTPLKNGGFALTWCINTDGWGDFRLATQTFAANGAAVTGVTPIGTAGGYFEAAATADGGYVVMYLELSQGNKTATFNSSGAAVSTIDEPTGTVRKIAGLSGGGYVVVTNAIAENGQNAVKTILHTAAGQQIVTIVAESPDTNSIPYFEVTALANGNLIVAWIDKLGTGNAVKAQIYSASGAPAGGVLTLQQSATATQGEFDLKPLPDGGFALGLDQNSDVYLGIYSSTGQVTSAPTLVHQRTEGQQSLPDIRVLPDGRLILRWSDTTDGKAYTQMYDPRSAGIELNGIGTDDRYSGSQFNDVLSGNGGNDRLDGQGGDDVLTGGLGDDALFGGAGNDRAIFSGKRSDYAVSFNADGSVTLSDTRSGGDGRDTLSGIEVFTFADKILDAQHLVGPENLRLVGTKRKDKLVGGDGDDMLYGRQNRDLLTGGDGKDVFVFNTKPTKSNVDKIRDYVVKDDSIYLENKYFNVGSKGSAKKPVKLAKKMFHVGSEAHDANDRIIYNKKKGILYFDDDGNGAHKAVAVATVTKYLKMTYHDFLVI